MCGNRGGHVRAELLQARNVAQVPPRCPVTDVSRWRWRWHRVIGDRSGCERLLVSFVGMQPIVATLILLVAAAGWRSSSQRPDHHHLLQPYFFIGNGFVLGIPFSLSSPPRCSPCSSSSCAGLPSASSSRRSAHPVAARFTGVRASSSLSGCMPSAPLRRHPGLIVSSNVKSATGQRRPAPRAGRHPRRGPGGTSLSGGRFTLLGSVVGALIIQTLTTTIYSVGVPPR